MSGPRGLLMILAAPQSLTILQQQAGLSSPAWRYLFYSLTCRHERV
jgi:hypothetical protein